MHTLATGVSVAEVLLDETGDTETDCVGDGSCVTDVVEEELAPSDTDGIPLLVPAAADADMLALASGDTVAKALLDATGDAENDCVGDGSCVADAVEEELAPSDKVSSPLLVPAAADADEHALVPGDSVAEALLDERRDVENGCVKVTSPEADTVEDELAPSDTDSNPLFVPTKADADTQALETRDAVAPADVENAGDTVAGDEGTARVVIVRGAVAAGEADTLSKSERDDDPQLVGAVVADS